MESRFRQLRAVLRTAMTWGAAWGAAGGTVAGILGLFDANPGIESLPERVGVAIFAGVAWGIRFGIAGAVIGTIFSAAVRLTYLGRRLRDIHPARFALLGGIVGGVGVPLYLQMMNVLTSGGMISWGLVMDDGIWASVFGAAAAGGSILLARRAEALAPAVDLDSLDEPTAFITCPCLKGTTLPCECRPTRVSNPVRRRAVCLEDRVRPGAVHRAEGEMRARFVAAEFQRRRWPRDSPFNRVICSLAYLTCG